MRRLPRLLALLPLAACAEFPALDARLSPADLAAPAPALIPLADILAQADASPDVAATATDLAGRAEALGARAAGLPPAGGGDAERVSALADRAAGLRAPVLTADERARLDPGAG